MKRLIGIILILMTFSFAWAKDGTIRTNGAVFGTWPAGSNVVIDGPTYVPGDKSLVIEPGVRLLIKTTSPFVVYGSFEAIGTAEAPIVIIPDENWWGFNFCGRDQVCTLNWVNMTSDAGMAAIAVSATDVWLSIAHCDLRAKYFALRVEGGLLHVENNSFLTTAVHSHTVDLTNLSYQAERNCVTGNYFKANMVRAIVPYDSVPPSYDITVGLQVVGSTNLCISDNNSISVQAPGECYGVHFEPGVSGGPEESELSRSTVTVHGLKGAPRGVIQANGGRLFIVNCNVDVLDEMEGSDYPPIGIIASQSALVTVNSSTVQLGQGGLFFHAPNHGSIYADYLVWWENSRVLVERTGPNRLHGSAVWDIPGVEHGEHVVNADPNFRLEGTWGEWTTLEQVQRYYSINWGSPCIDSGDSQFGLDPDGTLPDIGQYYYDQTASVVDERPGLPADFSVEAPYPNPFNSTVIIPLAVQRSGQIDITVYDVLGREVTQLVSGFKAAGIYRIAYTASDLTSGQYFVSVRYNGQSAGVRPIQLIR